MKISLLHLLIIGCGGFFGAVCRFLATTGVQHLLGKGIFPYGTLAVNMLGCFIMGVCVSLAEKAHYSQEVKLLIMTGFLGAFTTYSTFGLESFTLLKDQQYLAFFGYIGLHFVIGIVAIWCGFVLVKSC